MSTKVLKVPFTVQGIDRAVRWLERYAKDLETKINELISAMLKEGEMTAKISLLHYDTGETMNSIMGYREGNTGIIIARGNAIWIEFGTGVHAPMQTDHPLLGDVKGIVHHGEYGKKHGADPNGWYYPGKDGKWHHTMGIPSNPFMYSAAQMLRRQYKRIASEVFK